MPTTPTTPSTPKPTAPRPPRIALIGHCGPDSWMLKGVVSRAFPGAEISMINDAHAAKTHAQQADLLLVNRKLDGDFDSDSGLDLIAALVPLPQRHAAIMLVSNFADAQAHAESLGAAPGFGKSSAGSPETARRMQAAVAAAQTA